MTTESPGIALLVDAEVGGAVQDQRVELLEGARVDEQVDALAGGELAAVVLRLDAPLAAAEGCLLLAVAQVVESLLDAQWTSRGPVLRPERRVKLAYPSTGLEARTTDEDELRLRRGRHVRRRAEAGVPGGRSRTMPMASADASTLLMSSSSSTQGAGSVTQCFSAIRNGVSPETTV